MKVQADTDPADEFTVVCGIQEMNFRHYAHNESQSCGIMQKLWFHIFGVLRILENNRRIKSQ